MSDFLSSMASSSLLRADGVRAGSGVTGLTSRVASARPPLSLELSPFDLIAEAKLASPSDGRLITSTDSLSSVLRLAATLARARPAALSVLTEPTRFGGALSHLDAVAATSDIPVMRKDFLVDPIQVLEARAAGASGVLLIACIVDRPLLVEMTDLALELGMFVLVEVFDEQDLDDASAVFDRDILLGVNSRNLADLSVEDTRHRRMIGLLPTHVPAVAESGITDPSGAARVASLGYRMALVGTSLVTSGEPEGEAREMIDAGRQAVKERSPA